LGATYADIRVVRTEREGIQIKNGTVEALSLGEEQGFGVRVLADGAWGFASSSILDNDTLDRVVAEAVRIARASARVRTAPAELGAPMRHVDRYRTPIEIDPFSVSIEEKLGLLSLANENLRKNKGVNIATTGMDAIRNNKLFASTEGSYIEQELYNIGCSMEATAVREGEVQTRSYPSSLGGQWASEGYELVKRWDLPGNAERIAEEAVALLDAPQCPPGVKTIVLDSSQVALQIHESCGHPIELDRVMGMEASFAGTSFMTLDKLDNLQYGSEIVNIVADATIPNGLGSFKYDDEGVPAQRFDVIKDGIFRNYLMDLETAAMLGKNSNGTARSDGWNRIPMIRMTNISIVPGTGTLDDLISEVDDGLYLCTNRSWSIDDKRLNFQFGTEMAYEIKGGKLGQMYRNATYTGNTPDFWNSCDRIAGPDAWVLWGVPNCGKGEPMQIGRVGHGAAPARFRNVKVGVV
ncbi:MAG TPA: TldD/PmbA family protein, partial [Chloroflexia bacterium]|nr:TldD/PmbA family protein [Chloroflexia bacterium]